MKAGKNLEISDIKGNAPKDKKYTKLDANTPCTVKAGTNWEISDNAASDKKCTKIKQMKRKSLNIGVKILRNYLNRVS